MSKERSLSVGHSFHLWAGAFAILFILAGVGWVVTTPGLSQRDPALPAPGQYDVLTPGPLASGTVAQMDSAPFIYDAPQTWTVDARGADPHEPADPWTEPSGVVTFDYTGDELALLLAVGDYWGYLYITVDGEPANLLARIPGNVSARGEPAGYTTFYAPEKTVDGAPVARWVPVHRASAVRPAASDAPHTVRIEVWRSWGQVPLRAVAVDALPPPPRPSWPGVALLLLGAWTGLLVVSWAGAQSRFARLLSYSRGPLRLVNALLAWGQPWLARHGLLWAAGALLMIAVSAWWQWWPLCLLGVAGLAWVSIRRPALWWSALLLGLPMYFSVTLPILPGRNLGLIDVGVLGGLIVMLLSRLTDNSSSVEVMHDKWHRVNWSPSFMLLAAIISWALVSTVAAEQLGVALREWRTVFLTAGIVAGLLALTLRQSPQTPSDQWVADRWLLLGAWLLGGVLMALLGVGQYASDTMTIEAEGVRRVRGLYGSPNNLALYLERTLAVSLGLVLFGAQSRWRWFLGVGVLVQLMALLLTFSKGGIVLALPAMLAGLAVAGLLVDRARRPRQLFPVLAGIALVSVLALVPYLNTARFRDLLNLSGGTGFVRLQLWRSAWAMALDHPLLGVGPDNFLYAFRSRYILPAAWQEPNLNHPHNWPLDWWTRLGVPGLLLALTWFGYAITRTVHNLRRGRSVAINAGVLAATAAALAHGLIDVSYALPDLMLVWVWLFVLIEVEPSPPT